jgi:DNA (cytosine-5)-methyltransferase 1
MELLTTTEMAEKWNISRRRVTTLCKEGRIEGAILRGNTWLIPEDTIKPEDPRRIRKIGQAEE